jgi:hypothetical protein
MRFFAFKAWPKAQLFYSILMNFKHKHIKDITNINKEKMIVGML